MTIHPLAQRVGVVTLLPTLWCSAVAQPGELRTQRFDEALQAYERNHRRDHPVHHWRSTGAHGSHPLVADTVL